MTRAMLASALDAMERHAREIGVKGVAVAAYLENGDGMDWVADMRVVDSLKYVDKEGKGFNFVGVAFQKACEMMDTHQNSGGHVRPVLAGECGWQGGAIEKHGDGYVLGAFSGGTSEQDFEISTCGVRLMSN